ncbi:hypothetical protein PAALTS15_01717 [Paenibacillus alvei TS-15]|uniref:DUF485 domain-containing protein n=1 Tax=Paenibacillus alvei TS-15 TaxID=1117108 RepID=S9SYD2_PAEAL|nr:DUF485 domain-containing protein [Paenibacillus alvei]EPY09103.1 hypothetical protein PAALTS15_01717 [Paenibacillus alvei TS-15]
MAGKKLTAEHTRQELTPEQYSSIAKSDNFRKLIRTKKAFIIPFTIFFLCFYFALPILTSYTDILNYSFYGSITWAWVFAFLQFVMTWAFCMIYYKKASKFDKASDQIIAEKGK